MMEILFFWKEIVRNLYINAQKSAITWNTWLCQGYHQCDSRFPLCSFSSQREEKLPFPRKIMQNSPMGKMRKFARDSGRFLPAERNPRSIATEKMEIIIRNIEKRTVVALDDLASAQRKSRNQYLKEQLTLLANQPILHEQEERYQRLLKKTLAIIKENTQAMEELFRSSGGR